MPDFKQRSQAKEIMDDLAIAGEELDQSLVELDGINRWLGGNAVTFRGLKKILQNNDQEGELVIADLGCGGGGMLRLISSWAAKRKINVSLHGIDANENVISFAIEQSKSFSNTNFISQDVLAPDFSNHTYDIVLATLFLHHFNQEQLIEIFRKLSFIATYGIVVNDLHRHWLAYYGFKLVSTLFSRSKMVKYDGLVSVLRGFKRKELEEILKKAGILNYQLKWRWAFRWELVIWV